MRQLVLTLAAAFFLAANSVEGSTASPRSLTIAADEVHFQGPVQVKGPSNIKNIGQGTVQIRDKAMKNAILIGTSTRSEAGPGQRIQPVEGSGVGLSTHSEKGGVFVSSGLGQVGINDLSGKYDGDLHIAGELTSDIIVAPFSGTTGPAVLLHAASSHNTILVGQPENDRLKYAIGRGKLVDRSLTVAVPSVAEYDGAGKAPYIVYQSPNKVLAAFKAGSASMYLSGNMGVSGDAPSEAWKSGSKSNLNIRGDLRLQPKSGSKANDVAVSYPASGKNPSFQFRTGSPTEATAVDTRMLVAGTKDAVTVGINTLKPQTTLDVRGHLNIEGDDHGNAVIYFPASGSNQGFSIRSSSDPKPGADAKDTRFHISAKGFTGINTADPEHGLCIHPKEETEKGEDLSIPKGSLHLHGGIHDLDRKRSLTLNGENNFKALNIETGISVGSKKAQRENSREVHIEGSKNPTLLISQKLKKPVSLLLQTGPASWTLQGTSTDLNVISSKVSQSKLYVTKEGNVVVGDKEKPQYGLQIETNHPEHTNKANDIYLAKGSLHVKGGVFKKSTVGDQPKIWRLQPDAGSHIQDIGVSDNLAIGTEKKYKQWGVYVEQGRSVSAGGFGFAYTAGAEGTISYNEYVVSQGGQQVKKLHNNKASAAALRLGSNGLVSFEGTMQPGILKMSTLMTLNAPAAKVTFNKFADFGMESGDAAPKFPLRVKGGSDGLKSSIAFGHIATSMGLLGSTPDFAFLGTRDEKKFIAFQHADGKVGVGTTAPTEEFTVRTSKADSDIHFTSSKVPGKVALLTMEAGGSTKLSTSAGDVKSAMFKIQDFSELDFSNAGASAPTVFDRANAPPTLKKGAEFEPPVVEFREGNVGFGVEKPEKNLHIDGDHWSQGQLVLRHGMAQANSMMSELTEMIQLGEGSDAQTAGPSPGALESPEHTNVLDAVTKLARLVRRNHARLGKQTAFIGEMQSALASLSK